MTKTRTLVKLYSIAADRAYSGDSEQSRASTLSYLISLLEVFEREYKSAESILDAEIDKANALPAVKMWRAVSGNNLVAD